MSEFLDFEICEKLREKINQSPIFAHDDKYRSDYYLLCAVMDRVDSSIKFLNAHSQKPKSEEDLIIFFVFACMIIDAVKLTHKQLNIEYKYDLSNSSSENYIYFGETCSNEPMNLADSVRPTDDKFFEYIRSLVFAHPFETNRPRFFKKDEVQYSPWVIVNSFVPKTPDAVGVRVYTNIHSNVNSDSIQSIVFSYSTLKEYIKSRYQLFESVTKWVDSEIEKSNAKFAQRKINRNLPPSKVLQDVLEILEARFVDSYDIKEAISFLECDSSVQENDSAIENFRNAIAEIIPNICDEIDALNYDWTFDDILRARPRVMHNGAHYQLEKIYDYLNDYHDCRNQKWGLEQANAFANEFAKKHVIIKPFEMSYDEVKMLVSLACYFEKLEQEAK